MTEVLKFGKVIRIDGKDYVYLGATKETVYIAQVLNVEQTRIILQRYQRITHSARQNSNPVYKIIKLTTEEFQNKGAHCHRTGHDAGKLELDLSVLGDLNQQDKQAIKDELLVDDGFVASELQQLIK